MLLRRALLHLDLEGLTLCHPLPHLEGQAGPLSHPQVILVLPHHPHHQVGLLTYQDATWDLRPHLHLAVETSHHLLHHQVEQELHPHHPQ